MKQFIKRIGIALGVASLVAAASGAALYLELCGGNSHGLC